MHRLCSMSNVNAIERQSPGLREFFDERGIRYGWVAEKLGISPSYLTKLMNGRDALPRKHADALAALFSVPANTFLPESNE